MISINKLSVLDNFSTQYLLITWELAPTTDDVSGCVYVVYRSTSPSDAEFVEIASIPNEFSYRDSDVDLLKSALTYYYKVGVITPDNPTPVMHSEVASIYTEKPDYVADAIIFSNEVLLDVIDNPTMRLLSRKHTGQQCPVCWDPVSRNVRKSNCTSCYGTGYTGGYSQPVEIKASFQTEGLQLGVNDNSILSQKLPTQGWISNFPILMPEDVLVDHRNNRYKILSVQPTTKGRTLLRQIFQLQSLPPTDIAYKIQIS